MSDLIVWSDELYAGGIFTEASGATVNYIARWDGSTWQPVGEGTNGQVVSLSMYKGELIAAGLFTTAGGIAANRVARWDGASWHALGSGMDDWILDTCVIGDQLIASGRFTTAGEQPVNYIAAWDGEAWRDLDNGMDMHVESVWAHNGEVFAGGRFVTAGNAGVSGIARWDGSSWHGMGAGMSSGNPSTSHVSIALPFEGELIVGGYFKTVGNQIVNHIAIWNGATWRPLGNGIGGGALYSPPEVNAACLFEGDLIVGGAFSTAGDVQTSCVARWDGVSWRPLGSGITSSFGTPRVYALAVYEGQLFAAGGFIYPGGTGTGGIARWDGAAWQPLTFVGMNDGIGSLAIYNGELIAAGGFTYAGGFGSLYAASHVARWNGAVWQPLGSGLSNTVAALAVYDGELVAGGIFWSAGGVPVNRIARWNGSEWRPLGNGVSGENNGGTPRVNTLAVYNDELIVGGGFTLAGDQPANYIARWDGASWGSLGEGLPMTPIGFGIHNGELIVGGAFATAGGQVSRYFARWTDTNIPWIALQPQNASAACHDSMTMSITLANGYSGLTFQWHKDGEPLADGTTPHGSVISGAQSLSLTIEGTTGLDQDSCHVVVSNSCGNTASMPARLSVTACGDVNGDGVVDVIDLLAVIGAWGRCPAPPATCAADLNGDGVVDVNDLLAVIANWD